MVLALARHSRHHDTRTVPKSFWLDDIGCSLKHPASAVSPAGQTRLWPGERGTPRQVGQSKAVAGAGGAGRFSGLISATVCQVGRPGEARGAVAASSRRRVVLCSVEAGRGRRLAFVVPTSGGGRRSAPTERVCCPSLDSHSQTKPHIPLEAGPDTLGAAKLAG